MSKSQPKKGFNERNVTLPFPQPMMSTNGSVVYPFKEKGFPLFFGSINFNEKCVEITDEMSVNSLKNMGFFGFHSKFRFISNKDLKKTFLKHNRSEDSEQNSCDSKTKNQIPLDSKYSNGKYVLTSTSIPNALDFSDVQSCDETPKAEEIAKSDTVVSQSSEQIGPDLTAESETEKVLKLSFLESFFLSYIFGSLNVLNTKTNDYMTIEQMWTLFGSVYSEDSLEFAVHYSAYHYFRSKGWVVRNGYTFGTHFLLYKEGPHLYHSLYSVLIQYSIDGQYKQSFDWYYMSALIRLSKNVRKSKIGDSTDRSPLHWAASEGNKDKLIQMVKHDTDLDVTDEMGWTPLMIATSAGHQSIVEFLVSKGADINAVNNTGQSALHYSASKDRLEITKYLIDSGCHLNLRDKLNQTPLHRAASKGNKKIVELLLSRPDIQLNPQDVVGNTPLHLTCEEERVDEAKILIKAGALTDLLNKDKKTAFDLCINESVKRSLNNYTKECQKTS